MRIWFVYIDTWPAATRVLSRGRERTLGTRLQPGVLAENFAPSFPLNFLSIFVHNSGAIQPVPLMWASLERFFPPAQVEYGWCQFWSKGMTSEVEERPSLITAGYDRHGSQWVNGWLVLLPAGCLFSVKWLTDRGLVGWLAGWHVGGLLGWLVIACSPCQGRIQGKGAGGAPTRSWDKDLYFCVRF